MHFLVKWKGYPTSDNSWEKAEDVHADDLIAEFRKRRKEGRATYIRSGRMDEENPIPHQHTLSSNMSTQSAPSSMASPSLAGSISPSLVSAPENTPTSRSPTPQLAICSQPILDNDDDSVVDYDRPVTEEDKDTAPPGYLLNDPQSRVFYPIYLQNPQYR